MSRRLTYEFVKKQFEKERYELLSKEYVNSKVKMCYICPNGHKHSVSWVDWNSHNTRCPRCYHESKKHTIEFIRAELAKEQYILLTVEYTNAHQKLNYKCRKGHLHSLSWSEWDTNGNRCPYCYGNIKKTVECIKSEFAKEGYKLLSTKYKNSKQKLDYICPNGHKNSINWNNWKTGHRCSTCYHLSNLGVGNPNYRGGASCEPYCDLWIDKDFKNDIKLRDGYTCQNPSCWKTTDKLCVHHIDYNKKNCNFTNLIALCNSCNSRANFNRKYWQKLYNSIVDTEI
jgi:hypothetical protein